MKAFGDIKTFPAEFIKYPRCAAAGAPQSWRQPLSLRAAREVSNGSGVVAGSGGGGQTGDGGGMHGIGGGAVGIGDGGVCGSGSGGKGGDGGRGHAIELGSAEHIAPSDTKRQR